MCFGIDNTNGGYQRIGRAWRLEVINGDDVSNNPPRSSLLDQIMREIHALTSSWEGSDDEPGPNSDKAEYAHARLPNIFDLNRDLNLTTFMLERE